METDILLGDEHKSNTETLSIKNLRNGALLGRVKCGLFFVLCFRYVCEAEMEVTRAELARVSMAIAQIMPLTPDGNRSQSWPIGVLMFIFILTG